MVISNTEKEGSEKLIFELPQPLLIHCMEQAGIWSFYFFAFGINIDFYGLGVFKTLSNI